MIVYLKGKIISKDASSVVIDIHGIGLKVFITTSALSKIPNEGQEIVMHTYLYVREGQAALYGFLAQDELELFTLLLSVSGIGPKGALRILSIASAEKVRSAIAAEDASFLVKISGIGRKTAQKLIFELKEKIKSGAASVAAGLLQEDEDAADALVALGYKPREARDAVAAAAAGARNVEEKVRRALQHLGSSRKR